MTTRTVRVRNAFGLPITTSFKVAGPPLRMPKDADEVAVESRVVSDKLTIHGISGFVASLYVAQVPGPSGAPRLLLLDGGSVYDPLRVRLALSHIFDGARDTPDAVVCTHAHGDHAGGVPYWQRKGLPTSAPRNIGRHYGRLQGKLQYALEHGTLIWFSNAVGRKRTEWQWHRQVVRDAAPLDDGSRVPGFDEWAALSVPGHTGHMVALYHAEAQVLYTSDFVIYHPGRRAFTPPTPTDIPDAYEHVVKRMRELPVRYALCSHGGFADMQAIDGGWPAAMDGVLREFQLRQTGSMSLQTRMIRGTMNWSAEPSMFDAATELPTRPVSDAIRQGQLNSKL